MNPIIQLENAFAALRTTPMNPVRRKFKLDLLREAIQRYQDRVRHALLEAKSQEQRMVLRAAVQRLEGLSLKVVQVVEPPARSTQ